MAGKSKPLKLFNFKEWLTLEDAAKHLSLIFDEDVAVTDVLRLALDKRLTLSVWLVNHAVVRKGRLVPFSECSLNVFPAIRKDAKGLPPVRWGTYTQAELFGIYPTIKESVEAKDVIIYPEAIHYTDDEWVIQEKDVSRIDGIWDLPMLAGEKLDVEHRYQMETGGPAITLTNMEGAFVVGDGVVCQFQEDFEDNEYHPGSEANLEAIKARMARESLSKEGADAILEKWRSDRTAFRQKPPSYYPAQGIPEDAVWVVRTSALREFEQSATGATQENPELGRREEATLLNTIGGLLGLLLGMTPAGKPQSVFKDQSAVINALLAEYEGKAGISKRTLEEKLAAAKRSLTSS